MAMSPDPTETSASCSLPLIDDETLSSAVVNSGHVDITNGEKTEENMQNGLQKFLDLETGPEIMYGPVNNPERPETPNSAHGSSNQPCIGAEMADVFYGPMNNTGGDDFTSERISKDIKDSNAIPGQCGLYNLGNTCFMNAGLQSLMATPPVIKYFLQNQSETVGIHSLVEQFSSFVCKFWSGQFSILYPKDLKTALGHIHGQFKDYRQHDCQEFLALLLDTLNDQTKSGPNTPFFITHNDLNNAHSQTMEADRPKTEQSQDIPVSMETTTDSMDQVDEDESPMPLTQLKVSTDGDLLEDLHLNNTSILKNKMSRIENYYAKETKTLNTNVLISESEEDSLNFDSSKYAKPENCPVVHNDIGVSHVVNEPMVVMDLKRCRVSPKGVKDINIYADMCNKNVNMYCDAYEENEKVKRSKFDTLEKNFQHQAFSKLNCFQTKTADSKGDYLKESCDMDIENKKGNDTIECQGDQGKAENNLNSQGEGEQKQEVCSGTTYDTEVDQDTDSVDALEQDEEEDADTEQDPTEKLNIEEEIDEGTSDDEKLLQVANKRWLDHVTENQSVIVKTFHGQYKSSVKCSECDHVSVTFEPFMYLSVPLPRANERQLCVLYIPLEGSPMQYLLVLDKRDRISKVKDQLHQMAQTDKDIIVAEVLDHHVARIVDDTTMLRYVSTNTSRKLYAFEMSPFIAVTGSGSPVDTAGNQNIDVFSHVGTFNTTDAYGDFGNSTYSTMSASDALLESVEGSASTTEAGWGSQYDNYSTMSVSDVLLESVESSDSTTTAGWGSQSTLPFSWSQEEEMKTGSKESPLISGSGDFTIGQWSLQDGSTQAEVDNTISDVQWSSVTTLEEEDKQLTTDQTKTDKAKSLTVDQWKSCSICLEELADPELLVHKTCGATFCHSCLEMSLLHYGQDNFLCPVCSCAAVMTEDFTQLADSDKNTEERMLLIDVTFCHVVHEQRNLIGHPRVLYLSSQMSGQQLYECVEKIVPDSSLYTLLMTDAQGTRCSRCVYTSKCTGCIISRDGHVSLRPGDTLCVCLDGLQPTVIQTMESLVDHTSMLSLRPTQPLSIYDCIQAFTESEVLDMNNPWFCPRCQLNQCANKSMTVWRCPDVLIVHLKRFVYHDLVSVKVDSEVEFPLEGLDLSQHTCISGPISCNLTYDLNSIVCHFGDLNSGHYTSFTKHPIDKNWYYYNDENVTQQSPKQEDFKNAYILMYHRRGADFSMPNIPPDNTTEQDN